MKIIKLTTAGLIIYTLFISPILFAENLLQTHTLFNKITFQLSKDWVIRNTKILRKQSSLVKNLDKEVMERFEEEFPSDQQVVFTHKGNLKDSILGNYTNRINIIRSPGNISSARVFKVHCRIMKKKLEEMIKQTINTTKCETDFVGRYPANITEYYLPTEKGSIQIVEYYVQLEPKGSVLISIGVIGENKKHLLKEFKQMLGSLSIKRGLFN